MTNPEKDKEFENNLNQLIGLLKKLLKNVPFPGQMPPQTGAPKEGSVNMNFCFFTFMPLAPEEFDEFEEIYEQSLYPDDRNEDFSTELNADDLEFLRDHGLKF